MKSWDCKVGHGGIAAVRWRGLEVIQRLFVTVRDEAWREIAPTSWRSEVREDRDGVERIALRARHRSEHVDFEWSGTLEIAHAAGTLSFTLFGRAHRDMSVCRLGLVVLHPVEAHLGGRVHVAGPSGEHTFLLEERLHAQPVAQGLPQAMCEPYSQLSMELPGHGNIHFAFEGDLFELEDQRNWGDLSFKTYCTPLRLGFPRPVRADSIVRQKLTARIDMASAGDARARVRPVSCSRRFPVIGREIGVTDQRMGVAQSAIRWRYLSVPVENEHDAAAAARLSASLTRDQRLQLQITAGDAKRIASICRAFLPGAARLSEVLVYGPGVQPPDAAMVGQARECVAGCVSSAKIVAATRGYFVELNRAVPQDTKADGVAFPLTATVHGDDPWTIAANVAAIKDMVGTARELCGVDHVQAVPLALYHPEPKGLRHFPQELVAPWLVATLSHAAAAGLDATTLSQDVIEAMSLGHARTFELLRLLVELSGRPLLPLEVQSAPGIHMLAVERDARTATVLIANIEEQASVVSLGGELELLEVMDACDLERAGEGLRIPGYSYTSVVVNKPG